MGTSKTDFSTVLIVGTNKGETKSLQIRTKHLNRFKHYAVIMCSILFLLAGAIVFLSFNLNKTNSESEAYTREITLLKSQIPLPTDTLDAIDYIQNIEDKLIKINQYLMKRGIEGFSVENIGNNNQASTNLSPNEIYALYDERLSDVLLGVAFTPIGFPANSKINSHYGYRSNPFGNGRAEFHSGIDFKGKRGDAVKSTADGKVIYAGWLQGYGYCIRIEHKNQIETLYGHLSKIDVKVNQLVTTGDIIGKVGSTGHSTGPHLHYEVRKKGKPIDPYQFLALN
jgi:murein DD-endopeptidase MepM/ murein hydrolase activator NlpD